MRSTKVETENLMKRSTFQFRVKPFAVLLSLALGLAILQLPSFFQAKASIAKAPAKTNRPVRATMGEEIAVRSAGRGNPWINLTDGRDLITDYNGAAETAEYLESERVAPLELAAGDFDEDGMPDLVSGYRGPGGGVVTIHRGNLDSVYPDTVEARARKSDGTFTDAPFLSPGLTFELTAAPDFLEAGDFDADGHFDVAAAERGSNFIQLMRGDGSGALRATRTIALPGKITALSSGEVNRADGIRDLVVGVEAAAGPRLMVFEGPESAAGSDPEVFDLPGEARAIAIGYLGQDYTADIAVAAGSDLVIVHGRDRKLSLGDVARASVPAPATSRRVFASDPVSLAIGDFTGGQQLDLAVLTADGAVMLVEEKEAKGGLGQAAEWSIKTIATGYGSGRGKLLCARLSSLSHENILMVDQTGRKLQVWMDTDERRKRGDKTLAAVSDGTSEPATLEVEGEPVAVLAMRLNMDGLSDLVMLRSGKTGPSVTFTKPLATITVCNTGDCGSVGCGSLRAAILQANQSPGADTIAFSGGFSGVPKITISSPLPTITETITLSSTTVGSCASFDGSQASDVSPQAVRAIALDGNNSVSTAFTVQSGGTLIRNFVLNGFGNGLQLSQARSSRIEGNIIGLADNGNTPLGNTVGIRATSGGHTIGGTASPAVNIISGNQNGIVIDGTNATDIAVHNNIIGADATLSVLRGNNQNGVLIMNGASRATVGGSIVGTANDIFGSGIDGVQVINASGNNVQRNDIGQHQRNGVSIISGVNNLVGGTSDTVRNNIFLSNNNGVEINGGGTANNIIQGNFIGVAFNSNGTPVNNIGNNVHGVAIIGNTSVNAVGGTAAGAGNIIAFNKGDGVSVIDSNADPLRNLIVSNNIFSNTGLGIDLDNDGPTANDIGDGDTGPNNLQNFPELTSATITSATAPDGLTSIVPFATIRVTGVLRSTPNANHFVQFYSTTNCTGTSAANNQQFLNTVPLLVVTDAAGNGPFDFMLTNVNVTGGFVNCVAMDSQNNTSEFSLCIPVTTASACTVACSSTVAAAAAVNSAVSFVGNATLSGCASGPVFDWDFGDNSAHSSQQNPTHTYTQAGAYNWRLTVNATGAAPCTSQGTITIGTGLVITNVVKNKKALIVTGAGFMDGYELRINNVKQKKVTVDSATQITGKKSGKTIAENDQVVIRAPDGSTSNIWIYKP
jgi:PKD repeat protein